MESTEENTEEWNRQPIHSVDDINNENRDIILPPPGGKTIKTIVLDMENTLMNATFSPPSHYDFTVLVQQLQEHPTLCYVQKRPAVDHLFLQLAQNKYEIIIFTSATQEYADEVLNKLDVNNTIKHRLYSDSCTRTTDGLLYKDLSRLGRDLKNVIIVDDNPDNYKLQQENAFPINPFHGQLSDREMWKVIDFCTTAAKCNDVRDAIRIHSDCSKSCNAELQYSLRELMEREKQKKLPACCLLCSLNMNLRCPQHSKRKTKTVVVGLFDVLIKASFEPLPRNDFIISVAPNNAQKLPYFIMKRPGVDKLLVELAKNYEIVVFTAAVPKKDADIFVDKLDVNMNIKRRLYRSGSRWSSDKDDVKNLGKRALKSALNVELNDVIIVDHDEVTYKFARENGFLVKRFKGNLEDAELYEVMQICKAAAVYDDVREFRKEVATRFSDDICRPQKRSSTCTLQ